jgi:hypothetical protein
MMHLHCTSKVSITSSRVRHVFFVSAICTALTVMLGFRTAFETASAPKQVTVRSNVLWYGRCVLEMHFNEHAVEGRNGASNFPKHRVTFGIRDIYA